MASHKKTADGSESPAARFLRIAKLCRARDLRQLSILADLVRALSELTHALQKERGASSIYLGSQGAQFSEQRCARVTDSENLEGALHKELARIDDSFAQLGNGSRLYARMSQSLYALERMPRLRTNIADLMLMPAEAVKTYTEAIATLLRVSFEVADIAVDPATSRALVALVSFIQGKEYAGQERAVAAAAFSQARFEEVDRRHLLHLVTAQTQAFEAFLKFAAAPCIALYRTHLDDMQHSHLGHLRQVMQDPSAVLRASMADDWYATATRRIDAMKGIEDCLACDLKSLCDERLAAAQATDHDESGVALNQPSTRLALLIADVGAAPASEFDGAFSLYATRSVLDVLNAQARRIDDMNAQLEKARVALIERKVVEKAKGLLMRARKMSEQDAYALMRQTAMNENKRLYDIAVALVRSAKD